MSNYKCSYGKNCECKTDEKKSTCDLAFETKKKMSKEKECPICHKVGFHKLSCPNNKERQKRLLIDIMQADEKDGLYNKSIPTLEGDEAEEFIRKADENVKLMRQRRCNNHVWRKDYLNGSKKCQVCGKTKEEPTRAKDVEE
jgi:hypothetical protein